MIPKGLVLLFLIKPIIQGILGNLLSCDSPFYKSKAYHKPLYWVEMKVMRNLKKICQFLCQSCLTILLWCTCTFTF